MATQIVSTLASMSSFNLVSVRTCFLVILSYHDSSSMYAYFLPLALYLMNSCDLMIMSLCQMWKAGCRCCCPRALYFFCFILICKMKRKGCVCTFVDSEGLIGISFLFFFFTN